MNWGIIFALIIGIPLMLAILFIVFAPNMNFTDENHNRVGKPDSSRSYRAIENQDHKWKNVSLPESLIIDGQIYYEVKYCCSSTRKGAFKQTRDLIKYNKMFHIFTSTKTVYVRDKIPEIHLGAPYHIYARSKGVLDFVDLGYKFTTIKLENKYKSKTENVKTNG